MNDNIHRTIICNGPKLKIVQCTSTVEWVNKMWHIHAMGYYAAKKMNGL